MYDLKIASAQNETGMTLIEVLAALVILALLATSLLAVISTSTIWVFKAGRDTKANGFANAIMEDIKAHSHLIRPGVYDEASLNLASDDNGLGLSIDCQEEQWANMEPYIMVEEYSLSSSYSVNLFKVTVTINWTEASNLKEHVVTSIISPK